LGFVAMRSVVIGTASRVHAGVPRRARHDLTRAAVGCALFELAGAAGRWPESTVSDRMAAA
jgi:hypothetical protein